MSFAMGGMSLRAPTERDRISASMSRTRPIRCSVDSSGHAGGGVATRVARVLLVLQPKPVG